MTGVVELIEKVNTKGNTFFSVRVAGQYVGNAYESVVKDLKTGDHVKATYETKNNFKNVLELTKLDGVANIEVPNSPTVSSAAREIPFPKGYEPHPFTVNEKAFYLAQLVVNSSPEDKKLNKKSLMTKLANIFELAKPVREFLLTGKTPDGTEELTDED